MFPLPLDRSQGDRKTDISVTYWEAKRYILRLIKGSRGKTLLLYETATLVP